MGSAILKITLLLLVLLASVSVRAQPNETGRWHYLQDKGYNVAMLHSGDYEWQRSKWKAPNLGFSTNYYWFRMELGADEFAAGRWYLWVYNAILADIGFFLVKNGVVKSEQKAGMSYRSDEKALSTRMPAFYFDVEEHSTYTIYLKVYSDTALQLPTEIVPEVTFVTEKEESDSLLGLFIGILTAMALYNLVLYLTIRDVTFLLYVGHVLALLFFVVSWQGIGATYLWPNMLSMQQMSVALATFLVIGFSTWFCGVFLNINEKNFKANALFWMTRNLAFAGCLITPVLPYQWAIFISSSLSFFAMLMVVRAMVSRASFRYRPTRLFVMGWTMYVAGAFVMGLNKFALIEVTLASESLLLWGAVFDMVLLCIALGDKFHEERNLKIQAQEMAIKAVRREKMAKEIAIDKEQQVQEALNDTAQTQQNYAVLLERKVKERTAELTHALQELELISEMDALTELKNRRYFVERLSEEIKRSQYLKQSFSVMMIDIDHFKSVNDTYGHLFGDECICKVSQLLQEKLKRPGDVVCRYGGEEFVVILPNKDEAGALSMAEELREHVAKCPILCEDKRIMVTVSIGMILVTPSAEYHQAEQLIDQADQALYRAKSIGRNCVCAV
jgi:diguanylate cyclase (GGDEF)-like protein